MVDPAFFAFYVVRNVNVGMQMNATVLRRSRCSQGLKSSFEQNLEHLTYVSAAPRCHVNTQIEPSLAQHKMRDPTLISQCTQGLKRMSN